MSAIVASGWVAFDVLARDAALAARVAILLRERLSAALIYSEPERVPSDDGMRPHLLHCHAHMPAFTSEQTRDVVRRALEALPDVGEDAWAPAHVRFYDRASTLRLRSAAR
jgi:hypothetical protein